MTNTNANPCPHAASGVICHTQDARATDLITTATTTQPPPVVTVTTGGSGDGLTAVLLSGALFAAIVGAVVNTLLARRNTRLEERARVRTTLAEAYAAYAQYKEFPFAVRRRRADQPGEERVRLSEALREVQARLSYYQAWTRAESPAAGAAYNELIREVRRVAGGAMRDAWNSPPLDGDAGMNIGRDKIDLSALIPAEGRFMDAANEHVSALTRSWARRLIEGYGAWRERRAANRATAGPVRAAITAENAPGTER